MARFRNLLLVFECQEMSETEQFGPVLDITKEMT